MRIHLSIDGRERDVRRSEIEIAAIGVVVKAPYSLSTYDFTFMRSFFNHEKHEAYESEWIPNFVLFVCFVVKGQVQLFKNHVACRRRAANGT